MTVSSKPAFWEGRVNVRGARAGREVTGNAYLERSEASSRLFESR